MECDRAPVKLKYFLSCRLLPFGWLFLVDVKEKVKNNKIKKEKGAQTVRLNGSESIIRGRVSFTSNLSRFQVAWK